MNADSPIYLVNTAIEYLLIVVFMVGAISLVSLRDKQANAYNTKVEYQSTVSRQLEFGEYNTGSDISNKSECVPGNHVIETIRRYNDGSIRIYVDADKTNSSIYMDDSAVSMNPFDFSTTHLTDIIDPEAYYHPFLIYDTDEMTNQNSTGSEITGISFIKYVPVH